MVPTTGALGGKFDFSRMLHEGPEIARRADRVAVPRLAPLGRYRTETILKTPSDALKLPPLGPLCAQKMHLRIRLHSGPRWSLFGNLTVDTCSTRREITKYAPKWSPQRGHLGENSIFLECYTKVQR